MLDENGFLKDYQAWNQELALKFAESEGINLSDAHWQIINTIRGFYIKHKKSLGIRPLINAVNKEYDSSLNSTKLHTLFPGGAKQINKIAGLPKPVRCI